MSVFPGLQIGIFGHMGYQNKAYGGLDRVIANILILVTPGK